MTDAAEKRNHKRSTSERKVMTSMMLAFAREYAKDGNAALSAQRAGYAETALDSAAAYLLKHPGVIKEVERCRNAIAKEVAVSKNDVLRELGRIALFDIAKLYDKNGEPLAIHEVDEDTRRAILEHNIALDELGNRSVKTVNVGKMKALELLAKHFGMLESKAGAAAPNLHIDINFGEAAPPITVRQINTPAPALPAPVEGEFTEIPDTEVDNGTPDDPV